MGEHTDQIRAAELAILDIAEVAQGIPASHGSGQDLEPQLRRKVPQAFS